MSLLTPIHPDLWVRTVPYRKLGFPIGRQFIVVRLNTGRLWIHSPVPWTPALRAELAKLGEVGHVVGPNCYHDECLREFQAEYPVAIFHAAPGLAAARRDLRFTAEPLSVTPHPDWAAALDQHLVQGMPRLNEVVFLHRASRSLFIADLAFNFGHEDSWLLGLVMRLDGAWSRFAPTRFVKRLMHDPAAVRASLDRILAWDFDRIFVGHGQNIETGGKAALREAFAFLP